MLDWSKFVYSKAQMRNQICLQI